MASGETQEKEAVLRRNKGFWCLYSRGTSAKHLTYSGEGRASQQW